MPQGQQDWHFLAWTHAQAQGMISTMPEMVKDVLHHKVYVKICIKIELATNNALLQLANFCHFCGLGRQLHAADGSYEDTRV